MVLSVAGQFGLFVSRSRTALPYPRNRFNQTSHPNFPAKLPTQTSNPQQLYRQELKRGGAVSLSQMERNILALYFGWEVVNLFLGGVLSSSLLT